VNPRGSAVARRRELTRERVKRFRARQKAGEGSCTIKYPGELIDLLVDMRWLAPDQVDDVASIDGAIEAWIAEIVRSYVKRR